MSDDAVEAAAPPKKKKKGKLIILALVALIVIGGGAGGAYYFMRPAHTKTLKAESELPQLVRKEDRKAAAEKAAEGHGEGGKAEGGAKYASSYYQLDKEFTSNLRDSAHLIQVGLALSTDYDDKVFKNVQANELAVRSAVLMTLSDTDEMQVFTPEGKKLLQKRLVASINDVLREKEGFGGIGNVYFTNFIVQ